MKKQYVTLNLENTGQISVLRYPIAHRKSLWRHWRQLSRLQKNLLITVSVVGLLLIVYSIIFSSSEHVNEVEIERILREVHKDVLDLKNNKESFKTNEIDANVARFKALDVLNEASPPVKLVRKHEIAANALTARQKAIVNAAKHAWKGYKEYAWGHDHLKPISQSYDDWFHLGLTLVDSLDTLYLMNLTEEFAEARLWIEESFSLDTYKGDVNLFEVTIRILGGLLSTYHLTKDALFLEKAANLGERLLPCFTKSPSPVPFSDVSLASRIAHAPRWSPDSSTAEVTTLQLEFRDLSRCKKDPQFEAVAFKVSQHVHKLRKLNGLVPVFINPNTGQFNAESDIKIGARGDSYYEYLLKQWLQTGKTVDFLKYDYIEAIEGISRRLVKTTPNRKLAFVGELKAGSHVFVPKMDHLICFLPGTLALGVHNGMPEEHMRLAEQLMRTCWHMYDDQPTHLAPEISTFNYEEDSKGPDVYVQQQDAHNLLRPEFVESLWMMYQITGNETYQTWGWEVFQAIERHSKVAGGYTSIENVLDPADTRRRDRMESFFISETLKYLFLLFDSNRRRVDIDKYVMNSEGHPLPIYNS